MALSFIGRTLAFQAGRVGSIPTRVTICSSQLMVGDWPFKPWGRGSNPRGNTQCGCSVKVARQVVALLALVRVQAITPSTSRRWAVNGFQTRDTGIVTLVGCQ